MWEALLLSRGEPEANRDWRHVPAAGAHRALIPTTLRRCSAVEVVSVETASRIVGSTAEPEPKVNVNPDRPFSRHQECPEANRFEHGARGVPCRLSTALYRRFESAQPILHQTVMYRLACCRALRCATGTDAPQRSRVYSVGSRARLRRRPCESPAHIPYAGKDERPDEGGWLRQRLCRAKSIGVWPVR